MEIPAFIEWVKSLNILDDTDSLAPEDINSGFIIAKLYNYVSRDDSPKIDVSSLAPKSNVDDWIRPLKNFKSFEDLVLNEISFYGYDHSINFLKAAKEPNGEHIKSLISYLVCIALEGPKKPTVVSISSSASLDVKNMLKYVITTYIKKKREEKSAVKAQTQGVDATFVTRVKEAQKLNEDLKKQISELEHVELAKTSKVSELTGSKIGVFNDVNEMNKGASELREESAKLDAQISEYREYTDQLKQSLRSDIEKLKNSIAELEEQREKPFSIQKFINSTDPEIKSLVDELLMTEDLVKDENINNLRNEVAKYKEVRKKLNHIVKDKLEKTKNFKDMESADTEKSVQDFLDEYVDKSNQINVSIVNARTKIESYWSARRPKSFLSRFRNLDIPSV